MQNQIEQIAQNIVDEMSYGEDGVVRFTIRGTSRIVDIAPNAISEKLADRETKSKLAKFLTQCGVDLFVLNMSKNGVPDYVLALIVKFYSQYAGSYCTELAKQADFFFTAVGVREWGKKQLGVEDKPQVPQTFAQALRLAAELQEQLEKTEKEKNQQQILSSQLLKINATQSEESKEYKKCKKIIENNFDGLDLQNDSVSEQVDEMATLLFSFKQNLGFLLEDVKTGKECYSLVSVTKWCAANKKQMPSGVKRWISRYCKAVSEYCEIEYLVKGQFVNGTKYDATEFHPKIIQFVNSQYNMGQKQKKIIELFEQLLNNPEEAELLITA